MSSKNATPTAPKTIPLTIEDIAHLADGTGELPRDTATRLQALICCKDSDLIRRTWPCVATHLEDLDRMVRDAGVDLMVDGLYIFRSLERLRSMPWQKPSDVLDPRADVPYQDLIAMADALADRASDAEKAELQDLRERLMAALSEQIGGERFVEQLIDRLLEVGEEAAEKALGQLNGVYRRRRAGATDQAP